MNKLTTSQEKVFKYIVSKIQKDGMAPSYKDIAHYFNFSSDGTVRTYLEYLEKKGFIKRHQKARGIQILHNPYDIPIIGNIAAGTPLDATENITNTINELPLLAFSEQKFGLKIKGTSMIDVGILDGDIAIIDKTTQIKHNDIAAVLINDDATLKRVLFKDKHIVLMAENKEYEPITLSHKNRNQFLGKYIGLIRET